jgi:DNA-directed RNA polymerase beta subunit
VISKILPDNEMPTTEDGRRADVIVSCLGVINRLNPSSLIELELNAIAYDITRRMVNLDTDSAIDLCIEFINDINPVQAKSFRSMFDEIDDGSKAEAIQDMITSEGIPIHQSPFYGNVTLDQMVNLYNKYNFKPSKFAGIENPMILGKIYYLCLKHHPMSKFSTRSARYINIKEIPAKNSRDFKAGQAVYSTTPVRCGKQLPQFKTFLIAGNS